MLSPALREVALERYRLLDPLHEGPRSRTVLAWDRRTDSRVVVKMSARRGDSLPFEAEAQALRQAAHPSFPRALDTASFVQSGDLWDALVLQHLPGLALAQFEGQFNRILPALRDVLDGVRFFHSCGWAHRALNATNMLIENGRGSLVGFDHCVRTTHEGASVTGTKAALVDDRGQLGQQLVETFERLVEVPPPVQLCARRLAESKGEHELDSLLEALGQDPLLGHRAFPRRAPFVGRSRIISETRERALRFAQNRAGGIIIFHGPPGMGKSRFLEELRWNLHPFLPVFESSPDREPRVLDLLQQAFRLKHSNINHFIERKREIQPCVLLLDDVDRLGKVDQEHLSTLLRTPDLFNDVLLLATASGSPHLLKELKTAQRVPLPALNEENTKTWARSCGALSNGRSFHEHTRGVPGLLALELERELSGGSPVSATAPGRSFTNSPPALGLILLTLAGGELDSDEIPESAATLALPTLETSTDVLRTERGWRCLLPLGRSQLDEALKDPGTRMLVESLADQWRALGESTTDPVTRARLLGLSLTTYEQAGNWRQALGLLQKHRALANLSPRRWTQAAEALKEHLDDEESLACWSSVLIATGQAQRALEHLLHAPQPSQPLMALAYLALGLPESAVRLCEQAAHLPLSRAEDATRLDCLARAQIKLGRYAQAREAANAGLTLSQDNNLLARLYESIGVAHCYLGDLKAADVALEQASKLTSNLPTDEVRILNYRGIVEYRRGNTAAAADAYSEALSIAQQHSLNATVVTTGLNLGSVYHQQGKLGLALSVYERSLRLAHLAGRISSQITLELNLAQLFLLLGLHQLAAPRVERALKMSRDQGMRFHEGILLGVSAHIHSLRSEPRKARSEIGSARSILLEVGAQRELVELELLALRLGLATRDQWETLFQRCQALGATDLLVRARLCEARQLQQERHIAEDLVRSSLNSAEDLAGRQSNPMLVAEVDEQLAHLHRRLKNSVLAKRYERRVQDQWEVATVGLPEYAKKAFLSARPNSAQRITNGDDDQANWRRYLEVTSSFASELELGRVIEATLNLATELSQARHCQVLLPDPETQVLEEHVPPGQAAASDLSPALLQAMEKAYRSSRTAILSDSDEGPGVSTPHATGVYPLTVRGQSFGVLAVQQVESYALEALTPLLERLASQLALVCVSFRANETNGSVSQPESNWFDEPSGLGSEDPELTTPPASPAHELRYNYPKIIGRSPAMTSVLRTLDKVTELSVSVLIHGESGTGKELVARSLHDNGPRGPYPFLAVNCGAMTETLLESELFGHTKGAFTGAVARNDGLFVAAQGGTLFLDEIGEMSEPMQVKLLRVLQERVVRPVGSSQSIPVDVRVIAATNRSLQEMVDRREFRHDLFYRLNVVEIRLPRLCDRGDDLRVLANHFVERLETSDNRSPRLAADALGVLNTYNFPGNIRELQNLLQRAYLMSEDGLIRKEHLQDPTTEGAPRRRLPPRQERARIVTTLEANHWNVREAARQLGVPRATFYRRLKKYGILRPRNV